MKTIINLVLISTLSFSSVCSAKNEPLQPAKVTVCNLAGSYFDRTRKVVAEQSDKEIEELSYSEENDVLALDYVTDAVRALASEDKRQVLDFEVVREALEQDRGLVLAIDQVVQYGRLNRKTDAEVRSALLNTLSNYVVDGGGPGVFMRMAMRLQMSTDAFAAYVYNRGSATVSWADAWVQTGKTTYKFSSKAISYYFWWNRFKFTEPVAFACKAVTAMGTVASVYKAATTLAWLLL